MVPPQLPPPRSSLPGKGRMPMLVSQARKPVQNRHRSPNPELDRREWTALVSCQSRRLRRRSPAPRSMCQRPIFSRDIRLRCHFGRFSGFCKELLPESEVQRARAGTLLLATIAPTARGSAVPASPVSGRSPPRRISIRAPHRCLRR